MSTIHITSPIRPLAIKMNSLHFVPSSQEIDMSTQTNAMIDISSNQTDSMDNEVDPYGACEMPCPQCRDIEENCKNHAQEIAHASAKTVAHDTAEMTANLCKTQVLRNEPLPWLDMYLMTYSATYHRVYNKEYIVAHQKYKSETYKKSYGAFDEYMCDFHREGRSKKD